MKVQLRLRLSAHDAHYGGGLVDGARVLGLFGDVATELLIRHDGDEGLFRAYDSIEFLAPLYAGDYVEVEAELVSVGRTSRKMKFEARKVIAPRPDLAPSAADVLEQPVVVCRASGTCVTPFELQRANRAGGPRRVQSGSPYEAKVGYCRAVRSGNFIAVSGSTSVAEGGGIHAPGDAFAQSERALQIIEKALQQLGAGRQHVVRTRMFVTNIAQWPDIARAHSAFFGEHRPATSMVEVKALIDPAMLVEIEADAVVP